MRISRRGLSRRLAKLERERMPPPPQGRVVVYEDDYGHRLPAYRLRPGNKVRVIRIGGIDFVNDL